MEVLTADGVPTGSVVKEKNIRCDFFLREVEARLLKDVAQGVVVVEEYPRAMSHILDAHPRTLGVGRSVELYMEGSVSCHLLSCFSSGSRSMHSHGRVVA